MRTGTKPLFVVLGIALLLLAVPGRVMAQPSANCVGNGEGYTCTVVANGQQVSLPFFVGTDDNETAYVVFCTYASIGVDCDSTGQWLYAVAFTNEPDTAVRVYANAQLGNPDTDEFVTNDGSYQLPFELIADSTCEVYEYCPGFQEANGDAYFYSGDNEIIIASSISISAAPTTNPCNQGLYCDTAAIVWSAPAGTVITQLSTGNSPNISWTMPSSGTYTSLTVSNETFSYTATLPGGTVVTGTVTTPSAYGTVTVTIT